VALKPLRICSKRRTRHRRSNPALFQLSFNASFTEAQLSQMYRGGWAFRFARVAAGGVQEREAQLVGPAALYLR
jgi:hypothetical protein